MDRVIDTKTANDPLGGVTPHLTVKDAAAAIDFYRLAFGAEEVHRLPADDGHRLLHACVLINGSAVMLADDFPEHRGGGPSPEPAGVAIHLKVDDADAWYARALAAGATVVMPLDDMFWGDRYGRVSDPSGHVWSIGAPIKAAG